MSIPDAELFNELWEKYEKRIYLYFRRQFDENTAEDLCQQTFLNAWRYICSYPEKSVINKKSWIFTVAKNAKHDFLRQKMYNSANYSYENIYETQIPVSYNLDDKINIQKALSRLSKDDRELLNMAQYLKSREIASVLGISASAVRSRIQKAKDRLTLLLKEYGIEPAEEGR